MGVEGGVGQVSGAGQVNKGAAQDWGEDVGVPLGEGDRVDPMRNKWPPFKMIVANSVKKTSIPFLSIQKCFFLLKSTI